jgi:four helix bundle protein
MSNFNFNSNSNANSYPSDPSHLSRPSDPSYYSHFKHGGYRKLASFQTAEIICDFTVEFCRKYIRFGSRTCDQMEQAARSGKQNIAEGSQASAANPKTEFKLVDVARSSLEELKLDYEDFLRQNGLSQWAKDDQRAIAIRKLAYLSDKSNKTDGTDGSNKTNGTNRSYGTYSTYMTDSESAANCALCLINQANYLLDRQLESLRRELEKKGIGPENQGQKLGRILSEAAERENALDAEVAKVLKRGKEEHK